MHGNLSNVLTLCSEEAAPYMEAIKHESSACKLDCKTFASFLSTRSKIRSQMLLHGASADRSTSAHVPAPSSVNSYAARAGPETTGTAVLIAEAGSARFAVIVLISRLACKDFATQLLSAEHWPQGAIAQAHAIYPAAVVAMNTSNSITAFASATC